MSYGSDFDTYVNVIFFYQTLNGWSHYLENHICLYIPFFLDVWMAKHAAKIYPIKSFIDVLSGRIWIVRQYRWKIYDCVLSKRMRVYFYDLIFVGRKRSKLSDWSRTQLSPVKSSSSHQKSTMSTPRFSMYYKLSLTRKLWNVAYVRKNIMWNMIRCKSPNFQHQKFTFLFRMHEHFFV